MDIIERFQQKFERWFERFFSEGSENGLRPKDVLRRILDAMEEARDEGFDGKIYVPNKYVLEIALSSPDEREYLFSFLDEDELIDVLRKYMLQNGYYMRGSLEFLIVDVDPDQASAKLNVKAKYEKGGYIAPSPRTTEAEQGSQYDGDEMQTVADAYAPFDSDDEELTIAAVPKAWAALLTTSADGRRSLNTLSKGIFYIGRSKHSGNDLILSGDGLVSKRHARIEQEHDGSATIYDLQSTNGVTINGRKITGSASLSDSDEIGVGNSKLIFQQDPQAEIREPESANPVSSTSFRGEFVKAMLISEQNSQQFFVSLDTLIGKAITCDIIINDEQCRPKQAQIVSSDGISYFIQDLSGRNTTLINNRPIHMEERLMLRDGDKITFGKLIYRFVAPKGKI